jgi:hypothetical protein
MEVSDLATKESIVQAVPGLSTKVQPVLCIFFMLQGHMNGFRLSLS